MTFSLNIAGNIISFIQGEEAPQFVPSNNLKEFIAISDFSDLIITVFLKAPPEFASEKVLFTAPLVVEQPDGSFEKKTDRFWSVIITGNKKVIRIFDIETGDPECAIVINPGTPEWELYSQNKIICTNPFVFPMDGLLVYNLLQGLAFAKATAGEGILIHASAVEYEGKGYLFTGVSGRGKTTMSGLWKEAGAVVIHDDLVALTMNSDGSFTVWSTPLNGNILARHAKLDAIFLIEHSKENFIVPVKGAEALTSVMSNTVQHNYDKAGIQNHLEKVAEIADTIPIYRMGFTPDHKAIKAIKNEINKESDTIEPVGIEIIETINAVLDSGKQVELSATGNSMFPTLRHGDRIVVKPFAREELPVPGSVVVFKKEDPVNRNPIFVMHRLLEIRNDRSGNIQLITRGDSARENDTAWTQKEILGIAGSYKRGKKERVVKVFVPKLWRYKYNWWTLWWFNKITKILYFLP